MKTPEQNQEGFSFLSVVFFLFRWKYTLIITTIIAGVVAFIISSPPITIPKYKAFVIFYPAPSVSVSQSLLSTRGTEDQSFLSFGEEEQAEQLLQVLNSDRIKQHIKKKYDLMDHYGISKNSEYPGYGFDNKYKENVTFEKTRFMSIRVSVMDRNPDTAAMIANDIVSWMDSVKTRTLRKRAMQALSIVEEEYVEKQRNIQKMIDSLEALGEKGVLNYEEQAGVFSEALANAQLAGNRQAMNDLKQRLKVLAKYGPAHESISERLIFELEDLTELGKKFRQARVDANARVSHAFVIDNATPPEKKAYPVRSLIVLISMISTFLLAAVVLVFIEQLREYRKNKS